MRYQMQAFTKRPAQIVAPELLAVAKLALDLSGRPGVSTGLRRDRQSERMNRREICGAVSADFTKTRVAFEP